jgi:glycosyltransferase involved in cell wall biosynthesis
MVSFYQNLDILVVPSLNSTESFGLVQIEAMINGTPCIASALPGVRQPVLRHGMGKVVPIGDAKALAAAVVEIAENKASYIQPAEPIRDFYRPDQVAEQYEALFQRIKEQIGRKH